MAQRLLRIALLLTAALAAGCGEPYDVVLAGGEVHDGRGGAPRVADVGIRDGRVATVGDLSGARAETRVDVSGLAVVPGFVDLHSHAVRGVMRHPLAENYLRQGVTTAMGGPDGGSPLPIGEWLAEFEAEGSAINMGLMVGHGTVRREVMGLEDRAPTEAELDEMRALVDQAMQEGAYGLSTGLKYRAGDLRGDRGGHRAREGRGALRRHPRQPHAGGGAHADGLGARDDPDRRRRGPPDPAHPPQGRGRSRCGGRARRASASWTRRSRAGWT